MKVSVIIPYNHYRGYLGEAVTSAERQENMILNKDYEIILQYGKHTLGKNVNDALKKAKGEYVKGLADDDLLAPGCLYALYNFAKQGNYDFVCADAYNFEDDKKVVDLCMSEIPVKVSQLAEGNTIHGGTVLYRRKAMPVFNEDLWTGEEYEYNMRMAAAGCKMGKLNEVVYWYRLHALQKSLVYKSEDGEMILKRYRFVRDKIKNLYLDNHFKIVR